MANHHMVKKGPVGWSGHTKERGPVAMVLVTTNRTSGMANNHMVKRGLWDGPVTLKNTDLWQWFLSQQIIGPGVRIVTSSLALP